MATDTFRIYPTGVYDDAMLYQTLELSKATLARARRDGQLRYTRKGNRTLYLGEWVLDWLRQSSGEAPHAH
jgi:hypothetical protein